jgi:membrane protease YdiL (CAAX protease family)
VIAGALAAYGALAYALAGCPATAAVRAAASAPLVLLLALLAAAPGALQRLLARRTRIDLGDGGHVTAAVVMAATLTILVGGVAADVAATVEGARGACPLAQAATPGGDAILLAVIENLALFTIPAFLYVSFVHSLGPAAAARALGLRREGAGRAAAVGALAALIFLGALVLVESALAAWVPEQYLRNPRAEDIARSVDLAGALVLSAASAVGEEVFFRGFLQPRVGLLAGAVVFTLAHVTYGSLSEVAVVLPLALVLGSLYRRTGSLFAPIATHFTFNLVNLVAGSLAPPSG